MIRKLINKLNLILLLLAEIDKKLVQKEAVTFVEDNRLTVNETADFLKVDARTVRRWKAKCLITPIYIGGTVYFSKAALEEAIKSNKLNNK